MKKLIVIVPILFVLFGIPFGLYIFFAQRLKGSIKVGVLHSLTGTMAISERSVVDATLLAIEEINNKGGLLGKLIQPVVVDGKSDWPTFAEQARKLIVDEKVEAIFGCWTSASRKSVKPVVEQYNQLLFYPVQYEGLEESANIVYTGAAPNQQIIPAVTWCFNNLGKRLFLVGSDYVFPRAANAIIKEHLAALGGTVVGEMYVPLGSREVTAIVQEVIKIKPDVIINTINGDSNVYFFKQLRADHITPEKIPTMSLSIAEQELRVLGSQDMIGDYAAWNYFQTIISEYNELFTKAFKQKYGAEKVVSDPMEAGYFGVYLWAQAVKQAGTTQVQTIKKIIKEQSNDAPEGIVSIDPSNQHTWKVVRIGKVQANGQFSIIWDSERSIKPVPYSIYKTREFWDDFLNTLYKGWGEKWAKE